MTESSTPFPKAGCTETMTRWPRRPAGEVVKRAFDLVVSGIGLFFLSPIFIYLACRIRKDSPGPVFYFGPRLGRGGKPFKIAKFRTMYEQPQSYTGPKVTAQDDRRITPLGRWMRDTKLNELPQLWNVLKGEMSLVGPRPEDPDIAAGWPEEVRREVLAVRPGVTSPASVLYRNEESLLHGGQVMDAYLSEILPSKLRLDQLYVRHHSFWGDLDILFWTVLVLLPQTRTRTLPEQRLFVGPVSRLMERHVRWFIVDTLVTFVAMVLAGLMWRAFEPLNIGVGPSLIVASGFAILFSLVNVLLGVNWIDWSQATATDAIDLLPGAGVATILALLFDYSYPIMSILYGGQFPELIKRPILPGGLITIAAMLAMVGFMTVRYRTRVVTGLATRWVNWRGTDDSTRERILLVGSGESGRYAAWLLSQGRYASAYRVIGFVDDDLYKADTRIQGLPVLGSRAQIAQIVAQEDIGVIVFAIHRISAEERQSLLEICRGTGAEVVVFPDIAATLSELRRVDRADHAINGTGHSAIVEPVSQPHSSLPNAAWLEQLDAAAQAGDVEAVREQIRVLKGKVE